MKEMNVIEPDYSLIHAVETLADGADVHKVAQELNAYVLAIRGINECPSEEDHQCFECIRERVEANLRKFVIRKRLMAIHTNSTEAGALYFALTSL